MCVCLPVCRAIFSLCVLAKPLKISIKILNKHDFDFKCYLAV